MSKRREPMSTSKTCVCGGVEELVESHRNGKPIMVFRCMKCGKERVPGVQGMPDRPDWTERMP